LDEVCALLVRPRLRLDMPKLLSIVPAQHGAATTQTPRRPIGAGGGEEQAGQARCPSPPHTLALREKSSAK
jgi:hypothetical protein